MTREERLEMALRRALAEADYICTGPIPHGDCWACAAHDALAAPSPAAEAGAARPSPDEVAAMGSLNSVRRGAVPSQPEATACPECEGRKTMPMRQWMGPALAWVEGTMTCPACGGTGRAPAGGAP